MIIVITIIMPLFNEGNTKQPKGSKRVPQNTILPIYNIYTNKNTKKKTIYNVQVLKDYRIDVKKKTLLCTIKNAVVIAVVDGTFAVVKRKQFRLVQDSNP